MRTPLRVKDHVEHVREILADVQRVARPGVALAQLHRLALQPPLSILAAGKASVDLLDSALERLARAGVHVHAGDCFATIQPEFEGDPRVRAWRASGMQVHACDHPLPTPRNLDAAHACLAWVSGLPSEHTLLVLLSGGASAHLTLPAEGVTLERLALLTSRIQKSGADIRALNCVRKHLELLKGGRLAQRCSARAIANAIMSDVIGDPLDVVSSGPTVPDSTTFADAMHVLDRLALRNDFPDIVRVLEEGLQGAREETPKSPSALGKPVRSVVIASNTHAALAASSCARRMGFALPAPASLGVEGPASAVADTLLAIASEHAPAHTEPTGFVVAGEWTVDTQGRAGVGGPSQELALAAALALDASAHHPSLDALHAHGRTVVVTYSTDGRDGPTDAAGAIVSDASGAQARARGVDMARALADHDSHRALDTLGALIRTGPTGTNVNHVAFVLHYPHVRADP